MKEFYALLARARTSLPLKILIEQHGSICPWCGQPAAYAVAQKQQRGRITPECVEQVQQATDIVTLIQARVPLKASGVNFTGLCPFHGEKSPSFTVYPKTKSFHCFGCQKSGGAIEFVMAWEGLEFRPAVERMAANAGVTLRFEHEEERWFLACRTDGCASKSDPKAGRLDEIDFLAKLLGLKAGEAANAYFQEAGVVRSERLSPSIMPGQQKRRTKLPEAKEPGEPPQKQDVPRSDEGGEGQPEAQKNSVADAKVEEPTSAPATPPQEGLRRNEGGEGQEKTVTPCTAMKGETACGAPAAWRHPQFPDGAYCAECKVTAQSFLPSNWIELSQATEVELPLNEIANADELAGAYVTVKRLRMKIGTGKAFGKPVEKYEGLLKGATEAIERYEAKQRAEAAAKEAARRSDRGRGFAALEYYFGQLVLGAEDEKLLWFKRGLSSATAAALGYRSNPEANREILERMLTLFEWPELVASGLWRPEDLKAKKERRPNSQFCGAGRIRKLKPDEKPGDREWRDKDGWLWGWCCPILIPYFDALGRLISLRPHKGMGLAGTVVGTPHIYMARAYHAQSEAVKDVIARLEGRKDATQPLPAEKFHTVIITEGEFKAAALWQTFPPRLVSGALTGVCALPGINFGKHFDVRNELETWLRKTGARRVLVAFDDEDKSHKKELWKRHDASIWARYLATYLAKRLRITTGVVVLPKEWRVNGKADWDNALATLVHQTETSRE